MEYITVKQAAEKWGITSQRLLNQCEKGKVQGAIRFNSTWAIPKDSEETGDGGYKENLENQNNIIKSFQSICENEEMLARIVEFFPYPIHVYTPDGTLVLMNEACLKVFHIESKEKLIGKHNVLLDTNMEKWGVKEYVLRAFLGESIQLNDMKVPIQDIIDSSGGEDLYSDSIFQNITCFPIYNDYSQLSYVVVVFITSKLYRGKEEIIKGKEYIEKHCKDEFDLEETAKASGLSKAHFIRIFKIHTGFTPHGYYMNIKINMIKEKLLDSNLSISQAFAECGVDYNSHYVKIFKGRVNATPSEYRRNNS